MILSMNVYNEIAESFKNDATVKSIVSMVNTEYDKNERPKPFGIAVGSSGIGKTQLAFTLFRRFQCIYLCFGSSQPVYRYYESVYETLQDCIQRDLEDLDLHLEETYFYASKFGYEANSKCIGSKKTFTAGFFKVLYECLNDKYDHRLNWMKKLKGKNISRCLCSEIKAKQCSLVIIDEVPSNLVNEYCNTNEKKMSIKYTREGFIVFFLRNLIRQFAIPIFMGTHTSTWNMVEIGVGSRDETDTSPWCLLISKFPSVDLHAIYNVISHKVSTNWQNAITEKCSPRETLFVEMCLKQSRPWFSYVGLQMIEDFKNIDDWLYNIGRKIRVSKQSKLQSWIGVSAQMDFFKIRAFNDYLYIKETAPEANNTTHIAKKQKLDNTNPLTGGFYAILSHYALLEERINWLDVENTRKAIKNSYFPTVEADLLLHLCVGGMKDLPPFWSILDIEKNVSLLSALKEIKQSKPKSALVQLHMVVAISFRMEFLQKVLLQQVLSQLHVLGEFKVCFYLYFANNYYFILVIIFK